jgi:hypothetical protein
MALGKLNARQRLAELAMVKIDKLFAYNIGCSSTLSRAFPWSPNMNATYLLKYFRCHSSTTTLTGYSIYNEVFHDPELSTFGVVHKQHVTLAAARDC